MKNNGVGIYVIIAVLGLVILISGLGVLLFSDSLFAEEGFVLTLVYVIIVVGAALSVGSGGVAFKNNLLKKDPKVAKEIEIEINDERNIAIGNKAKAKAFNLMIRVYGALILIFAILQIHMYVIFALVASYLFVVFFMIYHYYKYQKEL